jgi:MFS family permease
LGDPSKESVEAVLSHSPKSSLQIWYLYAFEDNVSIKTMSYLAVPLIDNSGFSFISAAWAIGTVAGPLLGGGFSQNISWRWIFWINLPFIGVGSVLIGLFLRLNYKTGAFQEKLRQVDWIGSVFFIAALTGFLIPLTWGGVMYPWNHWRTLVPLILSGVGLIGFIVYEEWLSRRGGQPLIPLEVMKNRTAAITYFATFIRKK